MATTATSTTEIAREEVLNFRGALAATAELRPHPATDQLWLFRGSTHGRR